MTSLVQMQQQEITSTQSLQVQRVIYPFLWCCYPLSVYQRSVVKLSKFFLSNFFLLGFETQEKIFIY